MQSVLQKVPVEDILGSFTGACDWSMLQISDCGGYHPIGAVGILSKNIQNNQDAVYIVSKFRNATTIASLITNTCHCTRRRSNQGFKDSSPTRGPGGGPRRWNRFIFDHAVMEMIVMVL